MNYAVRLVLLTYFTIFEERILHEISAGIIKYLPAPGKPGCRAQYYDTGQDPGSLKWMQIKTGRFTVIYPRTYGDAGHRLCQVA